MKEMKQNITIEQLEKFDDIHALFFLLTGYYDDDNTVKYEEVQEGMCEEANTGKIIELLEANNKDLDLDINTCLITDTEETEVNGWRVVFNRNEFVEEQLIDALWEAFKTVPTDWI